MTSSSYQFLNRFYNIKELFCSKSEDLLKLDNCSSILNIYRKVFLPCSFIKIFAFEVGAFLKNNFIKTPILRSSILWCWAIPGVVELSSASYRYELCHRLVLKLKIKKLHLWGHSQIDGKLLNSLKIAKITENC